MARSTSWVSDWLSLISTSLDSVLAFWGYQRPFACQACLSCMLLWSYNFMSAKESPVIVFTLPICADIQTQTSVGPFSHLKDFEGNLAEAYLYQLSTKMGLSMYCSKCQFYGKPRGLLCPLAICNVSNILQEWHRDCCPSQYFKGCLFLSAETCYLPEVQALHF